MLTALTQNPETKVISAFVEKTEGPFFCAECKSKLVLKKGQVRVHHFSHTPPVNCTYGQGESQQHLKCKLEIYEALQKKENVDKLELERGLSGIRPDISFRVDKKYYVGIEVQISTLSLDEIYRRTKRYHDLKIAVCWVLPFSNEINEEKMSPKIWEKWIHSTYFGRVYYLFDGLKVLPVHFDPYLLDVPLSSWYESGGTEVSVGGYSRYSKRYRRALVHDPIDLVDDFSPKKRNAFQMENYSIPQATLWSDKLEKWWENK